MLNANHGNLSHHNTVKNMDLTLDILPHAQETELGFFRKAFLATGVWFATTEP